MSHEFRSYFTAYAGEGQLKCQDYKFPIIEYNFFFSDETSPTCIGVADNWEQYSKNGLAINGEEEWNFIFKIV